jgi:hypothetical protein
MAGFGRSNSLSINTGSSLLYVYIHMYFCAHDGILHSTVTLIQAPACILQDGIVEAFFLGPLSMHQANNPPAETMQTKGSSRAQASSAPLPMRRPSPLQPEVYSDRRRSPRQEGCLGVVRPQPHSHPKPHRCLGGSSSSHRSRNLQVCSAI